MLEEKYYHAWERKQFGRKYPVPKIHGRVTGKKTHNHVTDWVPLAPSLLVRKPSKIKLRSEDCLMNIEPKQGKLDFLEGVFSSHGDCPK